MDRQDGQDTGLKHGQITRKVIGCAFAVINELGAGFLESVYEKALLLALREEGLSAVAQHPIKVMFRGACVGDFYADLFVEGKVIVELKAVAGKLQKVHIAQTVSERQVSNLPVALLVNFGDTSVQVRRLEMPE